VVVGVMLVGDATPTPAMAAVPALLVVVNKLMGLYDRDPLLLRETTLEEVPALFQVATGTALVVWIGGEPLVSSTPANVPEGLGQAGVFALWGVLFTLMVLSRAAARRIIRGPAGAERCLVIGDAASANRLIRSIESTGVVNATIVGHLPIGPAGSRTGDPRGIAALDGLGELLEETKPDRVLIAATRIDSELFLDVVRLVKGFGVKVSVLPRLFEVVGSSGRVDEVDGLLLLGLPQERLTSSSRLVKRTVDVVGAAAALLLLAPLFLVATACVRLTSAGPVLVRRPALDAASRPFDMLLFRTTAGGRLTRTGRLLRRLSLEGLPQLVNVLRGEMSLVGLAPRPTGDPAAPPPGLANGARAGASVPPGLTGLWRTRGVADAPPDELIKLDYLYGANWSLWLDARILLRTLPKLIDLGGTARPSSGEDGSTSEDFTPSTGVLAPPRAPDGNGGRVASDGALLKRLASRQRLAAAPPRRRLLTLTAVVPATDAPATLDACLAGIRAAKEAPEEVIVVNDPSLRGPAAARNAGAARAAGDIVVFVDADVVVHRNAFARVRDAFAADPQLVAVFGSYDDGLPTTGRVATFRNLLHHHVHHRCAGAASTFWSGLGAVRRDAFLECGGFDSGRFAVPSVEDIDLGMRLSSRGGRIVLNPKIQGTHLKDWTLWEMVRTDFLRRGVPWVRLLLRHPRDRPMTTLNLSWRHRLSAVLSLAAVGALAARRPAPAAWALATLLGLNGRFYLLLARRHGVGTFAAGFAVHLLHHLVSIAAIPSGVAAHLYERSRRARRSPTRKGSWTR
jgi:lipopolysaccharide/colanic/teichoic acid biosynthesis glycosyltransferase/GT2 family glycosyltransferase